MADSDFETVAGTFDGFVEEDQETDTFDDEAGKIDDSKIDADEQAEEPEETEAEGGDTEEPEETDSDDQVRVTLDDGSETTLSELKRGYFRDADYTHKTTELAEERKQTVAERDRFAERTRFVETTISNLTTYLEKLVPPEPSLSLMRSDPAEYQYQRAMRENALGELGQLARMQDDLGAAQQGYSQEDVTRVKGEEDAKLLKAMPHLSDPGKRLAFDAVIKETAIEFGFTEDEVMGVADHRIVQLVHYARLGKRADENRANAKRRVEAPKKGRARPAPVTAKASRNRKAKDRLSKSGSIDDAMSIDFD